jgi:hypothetical protein
LFARHSQSQRQRDLGGLYVSYVLERERYSRVSKREREREREREKREDEYLTEHLSFVETIGSDDCNSDFATVKQYIRERAGEREKQGERDERERRECVRERER